MAGFSVKRGWGFCTAALMFFLVTGFWFLKLQIPDSYLVNEESEIQELLKLPLVEEEVIEAGSMPSSNIPKDNIRLQYSLLGMIPVKEVSVTIVPELKVYPGGMPIGIYLKTEGILVVGTGKVIAMNGTTSEPSVNILQSGDYILAVNGTYVSKKEEFIELVNECGGETVILKVKRNGSITNLKVEPIQTGKNEYKLGLWIRDDTQGIGTLTFMDAEGNFGALGHGISDVDTGTILDLSGGTLYQTRILSVVKGMQGSPGEMTGVIRYQNSEILGKIQSNTVTGIFGQITSRMEDFMTNEMVEVAYKQDIKIGKASILSCVDGTVKEYSINIEKINLNSSEPNKSMIIEITDPNLLEQTGGIVQGMSGSPIIQDGKLVGAVTHVCVFG